MDQTTTESPVADTGAVVEDTTAQPDILVPDDSAAEQPAEPIASEPTTAEPSPDDNLAWLTNKGIDPQSPEALAKVAEMYRNAEKTMHQSTAKASELQKALAPQDAQPDLSDVPQEVLDHPFVRSLAERVERIEQTTSTIAIDKGVRDFFDNNPEAKALESKMAEMVTTRPELGQLLNNGYLSLSDLHAMAQASSGALEQAKQDGGREALQTVASKQQARAVPGAATSSDLATAPEDDFLKGLLGN